jgi:hypothetical protein
MSHVQQTCPMCSWSRFLRVPQTSDRDFDDLIARHVGRSLQFEWLAHVETYHPPMDPSEYVLTSQAFEDWVRQEAAHPQKEETPPGEGGGQTVGANLPVITPQQAKALAETIEHTMVTVADSVQRFAEQLVPTLHTAQEQIVNGLRALVEQRPGRRLDCTCNGGQGDHQPGGDGCLFKPQSLAEINVTGQNFWRGLYGPVPAVQPECDCGTEATHLTGDPGCRLRPVHPDEQRDG